MLIVWRNRVPYGKNTEALVSTSKETGLGADVEETKYLLMSYHQNAE
jgi:hypothetical protein